ncbi:MAG TPA: hypothetical protein VFA04_00555 [Bryobacteraceae bacterium]|jgi:hypothetical protein|nr:hypothetical protein [Bryobacteraceae bacterium]
MDKRLAELTEKMRAALGDRLLSVILYGSGASEHDHHETFSDLNVMCVLSALDSRELADAEPVVRWWREIGHPSPLLLTENEVRTSTDVFAIEFHDMLERRQVLWGSDVIEGLTVDSSFYRAQVEHDLRAKQIRLRQKAAAVLTDREALLRLMLDSVSNFCVLARHAMLLAGLPASAAKHDVVSRLPDIGVDPQPFDTLLQVRERKLGPRGIDAPELFARYLEQVGRLVQFTDGLAK